MNDDKWKTPMFYFVDYSLFYRSEFFVRDIYIPLDN